MVRPIISRSSFRHHGRRKDDAYPVQGAGQVVGDLLAGQLQLASMGLPVAIPHVQSGKLRAIALTGSVRSPLLRGIPTVAEAGLPGFDVTSWYRRIWTGPVAARNCCPAE